MPGFRAGVPARQDRPGLLEPGYKGIGLFSAASAGPDTAFFQVETVVRKLMAF